ncbi:MAG: hypothetical protein Kow0075_07140 [Salibacteraceae bacterium]
MKKLLTYAVLIVSSAIAGCDIVEIPIVNPRAGVDCFDCPTVDSTSINRSSRKVLVEEFTGHKCTGCPAQTRKLLDLAETHKGEIIITSIHAGIFAEVDPPKYPTDFHTAYGNTLHDPRESSIRGYPSAMVNRIEYEGENIFLAHSEWEKPINASVGLPAKVALGVAADYNADSNKLFIRVSATTLQDVGSAYRLVVLCIEDSVIAPQLDFGTLVNDYAHRHVVRAQINESAGVEGQNLIGVGGAAQGEWFDFTSSTVLPDNVVTPARCSVVAFLIEAETGEIAQCEEAHVHIKK